MLTLQPDTSYPIFNHANGFGNVFSESFTPSEALTIEDKKMIIKPYRIK